MYGTLQAYPESSTSGSSAPPTIFGRRDAPDQVLIDRRATSGSTNKAGQPSSVSYNTVYDGLADMQPGDYRLKRGSQTIQNPADVTCVLPDNRMSVAWDVEVNDRIQWAGRTFKVVKTSPIDGMIFASEDG